MQAGAGVGQRQDALRMQLEAAVVERAFDARGPLQLSLARLHLGVAVEPHMHPVAAGLLGGITGSISGLLEGRGAGPAPIQRHQADAGADAEAPVVMDEAEVIHLVADLLCHDPGLIQRAMFQDDGELIAAQPGQGVTGPHRCAQQLGHLPQQLVANGMAAGIVDQLELVQVDEQQRMFAPVLLSIAQHPQQPVVELAAVDQAGQRVVRGAVGHLAAQAALLADIVEHQHHPQHPALRVADGRGRILDAVLAAVAGHQHRVVGQAHDLALGQAGGHRVGRRLAGVLVQDVEHLGQWQAMRLTGLPAGHALGHRVHPVHPALVVGGDDRITNRLEGDAKQLVLLGQFGGQFAQRRHIPAHAHQGQGLAVVIALDARRQPQVVHAAVGPDDAAFQLQHAPAGDSLGHRLAGGVAVVGMQRVAPQGVGVQGVSRRQVVQAHHPGIDGQGLALQVQIPDADAAAVGGQGGALMRAAQRTALGHVLAHILQGPLQAHRPAVFDLGMADAAHQQALAIGPQQGQGQVPALPGAASGVVGRAQGGLGFGGKEVEGRCQGRLKVTRQAMQLTHLKRPDHAVVGQVDLPGADASDLTGALQPLLAAVQGLLLALALADVHQDAEHPLGPAVGAARNNPAALFDPDPVALPVAQPQFSHIGLAAAGKVVAQQGLGVQQFVRVRQLDPEGIGQRPQLVALPAQRLGPARADDDLAGLHLPFPGAGVAAVHQVEQALVLQRQCPLGVAPQGHVLQHRHRPIRPAVGVVLQPRRQQGLDHLALLGQHLQGHALTVAHAQQRRHHIVQHHLARRRGEEVQTRPADHLVTLVAQTGQPGVADIQQQAVQGGRMHHGRCALVQRLQLGLGLHQGQRVGLGAGARGAQLGLEAVPVAGQKQGPVAGRLAVKISQAAVQQHWHRLLLGAGDLQLHLLHLALAQQHRPHMGLHEDAAGRRQQAVQVVTG